MKKNWTGYGRMARHLEPAAERLADSVSATNDPWLDIGSGSGNGMRAAQRRGQFAIGLDLSLAQLQSVDPAQQGSLVNGDGCVLPMRSDSLGAVTSNFGLIFASKPESVVSEVARCLSLGGLLAFTAWTPDGWPNPLRSILQNYLKDSRGATKPVAAAGFPVRLGNVEESHRLVLDAGLDVISIERQALSWHFDDLDDAVETITTAAGGLRALRSKTVDLGAWAAARREVANELANRVEETVSGVQLVDNYLLVVAKKG